MTVTPRSERPPAAGGPPWHALGSDQVLRSEEMDDRRGLSSAEAAARARRYGPNMLAAGKAEPRWHAFVRQYRDPMQIGLLAAGGTGEFVVTATGMATEVGHISGMLAVMKTVTLDVRQWLLCTAAALPVVVAAEIRKAVRRAAAVAVRPAGIAHVDGRAGVT